MSDLEAKERDERWELASWAANEGIWDWDFRTNKVYRSGRWFEMFGYKTNELADTPWTWENMIHPDDASRVIEQRRHHIEGRTERYYVEHRMRCRDGVYRWFLSRGQVIRDDNGTPVRMLGFYTSIQETIETRRKLESQNSELKVLQEISLQAIANETPDATLTALLNRLRVFLSADKAYLSIYDPGADVMRTHSMSGDIGPTLLKHHRGEHLTGMVWETGRYQYIDAFDEWPNRPATSDSSQLRSACGLPLLLGNSIVGVITLGFAAHRDIAEDEVDRFRQFAAIAALVVRNRQMAIQLREDFRLRTELEPEPTNDKNEFLNALADGKPMSAREITAQARRFGLKLKSGYVALVARIGGDLSQNADISLRLLSTSGLEVWRRAGVLYLLLEREEPEHERSDLTRQAEEIHHQMESHLGCTLEGVGVSLYAVGLRETAASFLQAREALDMGSRLYPKRTVHHYLDLGLLQVLSENGDQSRIGDFITHTIGDLIEYDRKKNGHLMETLYAILSSSSLRTAADDLFVHVKTLMFRKTRIEEILGESLEDSTIRLNLSLALQLYHLKAGK